MNPPCVCPKLWTRKRRAKRQLRPFRTMPKSAPCRQGEGAREEEEAAAKAEAEAAAAQEAEEAGEESAEEAPAEATEEVPRSQPGS